MEAGQKGTLSNLSAIAEFFREFPIRQASSLMGMRWQHIAVCILLTFLVAFLDGFMLVMLIPIAYGLAEGSFAFMMGWPGFHWISVNVPQLAANFHAMFFALAVLAFLIGVGKNLLQYILHLVTGHLYGRYSSRLSNLLFSRYLSFGKAYFDHHDPGQIAKVLDYNHDLINLFQNLLRLISELMMFMVYCTILILISWRLTLIVFLQFPILYLARLWVAGRVRRVSEEVHTETEGIAHKSFNVLASIPLYQSFAKEKSALAAYRNIADRLRKTSFRNWIYNGILAPIHDTSMLLALLVILGLAFLVEDGSATQISSMFVFFFVARLALPRLSIFHEVELEFEQKMPKVRQVFKVFDDDKKSIVPGGSLQLSPLDKAIDFRQVTFNYPNGPQVLSDISFSIKKGEMTTLVGPSGSGKTTIANLLVRFYDFSAGEILIDGQDIREFSIDSLRRQITLVNQEVILLNDTLRFNLAFGLEEDVTDDVLTQVLTEACLGKWVSTLKDGINTELGDRGLALSGGQRQRVAIARALLRQAPILILDEATSSLDSLTERKVQTTIDNAVRNCTSLVIAHRMSTIKRADKVVVVDDGRVVETGTLNELLDRRGLFHSMWEAQKFD